MQLFIAMRQRILMIEDDLRLAPMESRYLRQNGFEVQVAENPRDGLTQLDGQPLHFTGRTGLPRRKGAPLLENTDRHGGDRILELTFRQADRGWIKMAVPDSGPGRAVRRTRNILAAFTACRAETAKRRLYGAR